MRKDRKQTLERIATLFQPKPETTGNAWLDRRNRGVTLEAIVAEDDYQPGPYVRKHVAGYVVRHNGKTLAKFDGPTLPPGLQQKLKDVAREVRDYLDSYIFEDWYVEVADWLDKPRTVTDQDQGE